MNRQAISVSELNKYIKELMESDYGLKNIFVKGEISNFKLHSSGHMYFTLKDEGSKIKCIMFKFNNASLKFMPEEGMNVIVFGNISIYERDGQYQLYCSKMEPDGVGGLYLAYEQLKEKLQKQGLFDQEIKKAIPMFPRKIGVATSQTGAVIRDIINVATKRYSKVNLLLYPVKVQGDGAAESIMDAIEYFNTRDNIDVIIIGRGGGSIEELWAFNNEELAYAIRNSRIPVVSAVGHETDFTIADFVADLRASTPSHAAELCVPNYEELMFRISQLSKNLIGNVQNHIKNKRNLIENKVRIVERYSPSSIIAQQVQYVDNLQNKMIYNMNNQLTAKKNSFVMLVNRIDDLSPIKVIKRGYGYIEKDEQVIDTVKKINIGEVIRLHMHDGNAKCRVEEILEGELW